MTSLALQSWAWEDTLSQETWKEGKEIVLPHSSYRHRIMVVCYQAGRKRAKFANGPGNFGAFVQLVSQEGSHIHEGNNIVPVLPDGRLIMVVEQRPMQRRHQTLVFERENGERVDLSQYGPFSSLEFPGGGVDKDENFHSAFLRELVEETGVEEQEATLYMRRRLAIFGADLDLDMRHGVIFLTSGGFEGFTKGDGGLQVFALTVNEVRRNIQVGNITSAQAALIGFYFYQELTALSDAGSLQLQQWLQEEYVTRTQVKIKK